MWGMSTPEIALILADVGNEFFLSLRRRCSMWDLGAPAIALVSPNVGKEFENEYFRERIGNSEYGGWAPLRFIRYCHMWVLRTAEIALISTHALTKHH